MRSLVIKYSVEIIPCAFLQVVNVTVQNFTQFITDCQHVDVKCFFLDTIVGMLHRSVITCSLHLVQQKDAHMCDDASPSVRTSIHLSCSTGLRSVTDITTNWLMTNLTHSFSVYLFHAYTCFEQQVLIIRRTKFCQYIIWYNTLFISCLYMFRAISAHNQEDQIVSIYHLV
jgi:hypothetical protein